MNPSTEPVAPSRPDLNEVTIGSGDIADTVAIRAIQTENEARRIVYVTERWTPSPEERGAIANGADVYLTLVTGDGSPMPVQMDAGEPDWLVHGARPGCCSQHIGHYPRNHIVYEGDDRIVADRVKPVDAEAKPTPPPPSVFPPPERPHVIGIIGEEDGVDIIGCVVCRQRMYDILFRQEECGGERDGL